MLRLSTVVFSRDFNSNHPIEIKNNENNLNGRNRIEPFFISSIWRKRAKNIIPILLLVLYSMAGGGLFWLVEGQWRQEINEKRRQEREYWNELERNRTIDLLKYQIERSHLEHIENRMDNFDYTRKLEPILVNISTWDDWNQTCSICTNRGAFRFATELLGHPVELIKLCKKNKDALEFLKDFGEANIYKAQFRRDAGIFWSITEPSRQALIYDLRNCTAPVHINLKWEFNRDYKMNGQMLTQSDGYIVTLDEGDPVRLALLEMIRNEEGPWLNISMAYPPFIVIHSMGPAVPADPILRIGSKTIIPSSYAGVELQLHMDKDVRRYWEVSTIEPAWMGEYTLQSDSIEMTVFVEKVFPSMLNPLVKGGIIGAFFAVVLVFTRFIHTWLVNSPWKVSLQEIPDVDRIIQLCYDVFLVRKAREFILEQDLFAKLVFLFRSPETLIEWTRPKVE